MAQSIGASITALHAACTSTYASDVSADSMPVQVVRGMPGQAQNNAIVMVGTAVRQPITRPTMGPNRSRDTYAEIDIVISIYVPGGEDAQPVADAQALDLQSQLETYLRTNANNTLGGACFDAWVSNAAMQPDIAFQQFDDPNIAPVPTGRIAENTVTVTVRIRY